MTTSQLSDNIITDFFEKSELSVNQDNLNKSIIRVNDESEIAESDVCNNSD